MIQAGAKLAMIFGQVLVAVPVPAGESVVGAAPYLHKPHAALDQPAGDQATQSHIRGDGGIQTVQLPRRR